MAISTSHRLLGTQAGRRPECAVSVRCEHAATHGRGRRAVFAARDSIQDSAGTITGKPRRFTTFWKERARSS